ncbi:cell division protein FtsQ/DivIB [Aquabacterium sp. A7-Y]|uniref:cell division protein FtsQ/DivIB n=1 Tax=Aquabacterium sp. A7-Y TaxID=1349605 RepID=UPI00223DC77E|nr:cell division protein FtsQ/DivIB [Aquabacterium sp. A7-Y]MCW7537361.1 cell division protein FtsQ/DivIB [Aquabacterium sp. A7-Y]
MQTTTPLDIRLMNATAALLYMLAALGFVWVSVSWVTRWPTFAIRAIRIDSELSRATATTIRANALPKLSGNFFTLDLEQTRQAFQAVPWVRRAAVQRIWPDRLAVHLEEHRVAAYWGDSRLVNSHGEVFEANLGDVEEDSLPTLQGPEGSARQVLDLYGRVNTAVARLQVRVERLTLSDRGSWKAGLDNGAQIEMGRGDADEVMTRLERFVGTWAQVAASYPGPLEYADLRHHNGYAVRIKGITTSVPGEAKRN